MTSRSGTYDAVLAPNQTEWRSLLFGLHHLPHPALMQPGPKDGLLVHCTNNTAKGACAPMRHGAARISIGIGERQGSRLWMLLSCASTCL
jgi:hypothetical protein